jgi:orotidine-5'-phosphate decarboxylase
MTPDHLILALDLDDPREALRWTVHLKGKVGCFKVGLQLFTKAGPDIVREIRSTGARVFLDLKLHDIPNTVAKAVESACALDVSFLTLHALGGKDMMAAALQAAAPFPGTQILAVTILTSHTDEDVNELGFDHTTSGQALLLARLAVKSGVTGLVCSPQELALFRRELPPTTTLVTPGVRPAGVENGDQTRVATPKEALAAGSNHLVLGRPILHAPDPLAALDRILAGED